MRRFQMVKTGENVSLLPSGTVTLLFTDVEGSTKIAIALGDERFAEVLAIHNRLVREALQRHNGVEVLTEGDSFFVAFSSPGDAVAAALEAQQALERYRWAEGFRLRVRMGMHTGQVVVSNEDYVGHAIHKAKRISDAGHGGQILLSQTTANLVEGALPPGARLVDLGLYHLKDLGDPIPIFQLTGDGLQSEFPQLRSLEGPHRRLPVQLTRFVGRQQDQRDILARLGTGRLVTLTGPGGVGKTRLAIEVANAALADFANRVWFADLTSALDRPTVASTISATLGVKDEPGREPIELVVSKVGQSPALIVLDNCEQALDAVAEVASQLLAQAQQVRLLATSREPLRLPGEASMAIAPLETPAPGETEPVVLSGNDAVRLFVDRAALVNPQFEVHSANAAAVNSIIRRLDGLPLAIELAAAQTDALGPAQIDDLLHDSFEVLRGEGRGRPARHRTIGAVLEWSYNLLNEAERVVLDRLAVFRGTFSLEAVQAVVTGSSVLAAEVPVILPRLVRKSMVVAEGGGPSRRYRLLETIREFGLQRLKATGDIEHRRDRHFDWVIDLASRAEAGLDGGEQVFWLDALDNELDNIEGAFAWALEDPERAGRALGAAIALSKYWMARGTRRVQGMRWSDVLARAATALDAASRSRAMLTAVLLVVWSDLKIAAKLAATSQELAGEDLQAQAYADIAAGYVAYFGDSTGWSDRIRRALERVPDSDWVTPWAKLLLALNLNQVGLIDEAYELIRGVADQYRAAGDEHLYGGFQTFAADANSARGEREQARREALESFEISERISCASCRSQSLATLVQVDGVEGLGGAVEAARESVESAAGIREVFSVLDALDVMSGTLAEADQDEQAIRLGAAASALRRSTGYNTVMPGRAAFRKRAMAKAKRRIGREAADLLKAEGERLDLETAIQLALDRVDGSESGSEG